MRNDAAVWAQLEPRYDRVDALRQKLLPARNKRVAHSDHGAAFNPQPLGAAPQQEWDQFWTDLDEIVNIIHQAVAGQPMHINGVVGLSDVDQLHKALKSGACFDQLLHGDDAALTHKCADLLSAADN